jgi:shikimate dehydrogenase
VNINKETKIYGSFSASPGNFGCEFHNEGFRALHINAIYKAFRIKDIRRAMDAMRVLDIRGAGVSMPFKQEAILVADYIETEAADIGATNTLVQRDGYITADNTDHIAIHTMLDCLPFDVLYILGNGGYSRAAQYVCKKLGKEYRLITRRNWTDIQKLNNELIFNCTPVERDKVKPPESCSYLDCLVSTDTGRTLARVQAAEQFRIYTGLPHPCANTSFA